MTWLGERIRTTTVLIPGSRQSRRRLIARTSVRFVLSLGLVRIRKRHQKALGKTGVAAGAIGKLLTERHQNTE
jgi:hypothetical protein